MNVLFVLSFVRGARLHVCVWYMIYIAWNTGLRLSLTVEAPNPPQANLHTLTRGEAYSRHSKDASVDTVDVACSKTRV